MEGQKLSERAFGAGSLELETTVLGSLSEEKILIPSSLRGFFLVTFGFKNPPPACILRLSKVVTLA